MVPITYSALSLACAAGTGCGLARLKVWVVIPISLILMLIAIAIALGAYSHLTWGGIALNVFCALIALQISYLTGSALSQAPQDRPISIRIPERKELLHAAQTAIGKELRVYFRPLPLNDLSPQLLNELALLEGAE